MKLTCQAGFAIFMVLCLLINMVDAHKRNSTASMAGAVTGFSIIMGLAVGAGLFD